MTLTVNSDTVVYTITCHVCRTVIHLLKKLFCFSQMALPKNYLHMETTQHFTSLEMCRKIKSTLAKHLSLVFRRENVLNWFQEQRLVLRCS